MFIRTIDQKNTSHKKDNGDASQPCRLHTVECEQTDYKQLFMSMLTRRLIHHDNMTRYFDAALCFIIHNILQRNVLTMIYVI